MSVSVSYKNAVIGQKTTSGLLTLLTAGKYCEDDIEITNTESGVIPQGVGVYNITLESNLTNISFECGATARHFVFISTPFSSPSVDGAMSATINFYADGSSTGSSYSRFIIIKANNSYEYWTASSTGISTSLSNGTFTITTGSKFYFLAGVTYTFLYW